MIKTTDVYFFLCRSEYDGGCGVCSFLQSPGGRHGDRRPDVLQEEEPRGPQEVGSSVQMFLFSSLAPRLIESPSTGR